MLIISYLSLEYNESRYLVNSLIYQGFKKFFRLFFSGNSRGVFTHVFYDF